ncbi:MAG: hypothetical protein DYG89_32915 [Caldilinea sp. CFX5]|nr:hypothetical protein [Caldilinea sp. CFX5]
MQKKTVTSNVQGQQSAMPVVQGGLPVRTNLRAGLAWDELDDQAISLFNKVKDAVAGAAQNVNNAIQEATK